MSLRQTYVERKFERKSAWLWLYSVTRRKSRRVESFSEEFVRYVVTIYYSSASFFVHMIRQEHLRNTRNIIHMITKRNKQIKEELRAASKHLHLHSPATLECASAADYEGEVMSSELGVCVGCIGVGVAGGG